jgi:3',5'-cyclic AMP phosphodiesterase CpdA
MSAKKRCTLLAGCLAILCLCLAGISVASDKGKSRDETGARRLVLAQISDTHLGLKRAPDAADNLRKTVEMVNQRHPDAVLVTGDIGERPEAWEEAKEILSHLAAKTYYIPGNHDVNAHDLDRWRKFWGADYLEVHIQWVTIFGLDSQLLGNYDNFESRAVAPLSPEGDAESRRMLDWFAKKIDDYKREENKSPGSVVFVMQHVPVSRAAGGAFPADPKPYWTTQEPYRSRELELLHRLGVKHVFAGHWHKGMVYQADGITYHLAPATSWSAWDPHLGFAMHTISGNGDVKTEFVNLPGADPHWP